MILSIVSKYPYRISFTQNVSVNYELGVKVFYRFVMVLHPKKFLFFRLSSLYIPDCVFSFA
jgi:hypothetical protein